MDTIKTSKIAKDIYWVGGGVQNGGLNCNPYLLVDGDEAVLFDPGSVLDFDYVYENIKSIIPLHKIKYVVLHHQDPDFCSSVPLFEQEGAKFKIVTHWRTQTLVKYYGIKSEYYIINENDFKLVLSSGRELRFIQTPYLHFPGAIVTYDTASKVLFSSDLFGAFSYQWNLFAGNDYIEKMKVFHEHYMPSNDILRPVMEIFLGMDISIIAPQHGSIINENIEKYIKALRDLECGAFMRPIKRNLAKSGGYIGVLNAVLRRYVSIFPKEEVIGAIGGLDIELDKDTMEIKDYNYTGSMLWNLVFETILFRKELKWLIIIEPFVQMLSDEYDIPLPSIFESTIKRAENANLQLSEENIRLKEINERLNKSIEDTREKLIRCPVTGLYNYDFFKTYFKSELDELFNSDTGFNPALIVLSVDNMSKIKFSYGDDEVNEIFKNIVYTINDIKSEDMILFRLQGASFACYIPHTPKEKAVVFSERIRNAIGSSKKFIEKVTVSIGVVSMGEMKGKGSNIKDPSEAMYEIAMMRVRLAKDMGMNIVCSDSSVESYQEAVGRILVVDSDDVNIDVLKTFLENLNYNILPARDGEQALKIAESESPDLIISEVMIPKIDGFLLRERLSLQSHTKRIPFILVSHLKDEDSVERAINLGIAHYFKKPFMLSELLGVVKNTIKGEAYQ